MVRLGNSFATTVMCIACVLISIMPIKTTHRSDIQLASRVSAEGREEASKSGQDTIETVRNAVRGGQNTSEPSGKPAKVKAVRMSALWPKTGGYPVIQYFPTVENVATRPNISFVNSIFTHIMDQTCIKFDLSFPEVDCFVSVSDPTICVTADQGSDACFSDETGFQSGSEFDGEAQILHAPTDQCPFHEGVQSVAKLLGMLQEHRRSDRDETLKVMVTASGTDRLLFAQGQTSRCTDYEDDSPLDLFSVTGLDTSATTLRHGAIDGIHSIEPGMVIGVRDIRHQWILDYKRQRNMGLSFYDRRDLIQAYGCEEAWGCANRSACDHGGFHDRYCRCVCPLGFGGKTCAKRTIPADQDALRSNCSTTLRSQHTFTLADIGLQHDGHQFYACDFTLVPPGCMRTLVQVNTSSLRPLRDDRNPDLKDNNWCELYFTLLLKHSVMGWRTYCVDYFFNEETLQFMSHSSLEQTYGYIKMHIPRQEVFNMVAGIVFNITFVEVPECGKQGAREKGGAVIKIHSYTVMTAVFSYFAGVMLGIVGWIVMRGLCMNHHDEYPSHDGSLASSGSSSYNSLATPPLAPLPSPLAPLTQTPPQPGPKAPPPTIRLPTPDIRAPAPPDTRPPPAYPPGTSPPPPGSRAPQTPSGNLPMRPPPDIRLPPPPGSRPPPKQETYLPPIGGQGQSLSPRQGGLRASFAHWGGAALNSLRASFAGASRAPQGESRPPPQGGPRPPPQGGSRPPPQSGSRPQRARPPPRYKTSPSRPGARRAPS